MYASGRGVAIDYAQAMQWYQKAAEQGSAEAQYNLAAMFMDGRGVMRDRQKACILLRASAEQGYRLAIEFYVERCTN